MARRVHHERLGSAGHRGGLCREPLGFGGPVRVVGRGQGMTNIEIVGLAVSLGLLVYLFIALLKPEWFS